METVELKEIGRILRKRLWLIALLAAVAVALSGIYGFMMKEPVYQASAKLIVNPSADNNGGTPMQMNQSLITANIMLIETYKEIIRTNAIMDRVAEQYPELNLTADQLIGKVQVSSATDSQVMTLSATDSSQKQAAAIVNAVAAVFQDTIPTIMNIHNVAILSPAKEARTPTPVGTSPVSFVAMSLLLALVVGCGLALMLEYLDDSVKSEADVSSILNAPTLAVIEGMKKKDFISRNRNVKPTNIGEAPYATLNQ